MSAADLIWIPEYYNFRQHPDGPYASVVIAGSRDVEDYVLVSQIISVGLRALGINLSSILEFISGNARGIDRLGERYAKEHNIPVRIFKPDWKQFGKAAGVIRNKDMAREATHAIIIRKNQSKGSTHMANFCKQLNVPHYLLDIEKWYAPTGLPFD